ncbi:MAG: hypothetical protein RMX68_005260 [Aulosira sp. ZfuVER01]|nr:hypothetical protein [Aulosira sp. ZfuVER01]MDZ8000774.1 hypothetical protein [Aulosira sp. DedVER01a]MDZ8055083.1 hypothetical protein [Aulosira sp. ZfuCHP01]
MYLRLRRRRFGQLVIASAATTALANFGGKTVAQNFNYPLGIRTASNKNGQNIDLENTTPPVTLLSLDLTTGIETLDTEISSTAVDNKNEIIQIANKAVFTQSTQRITGLSALSDGTIIACTVGTDKKGNYNQILFINRKSKLGQTKKLSGFKKTNTTIEGLLATKDDQIIAIASLNEGSPPFHFLIIDPKNGKVSPADQLALPELPKDLRLGNLALNSDGKFYATTLGREGSTTLVQLDPQKKSVMTGRILITKLAELSYNKKPLVNDLLGLSVSPSGQLIALAKLDKNNKNSLLAVDPKTGQLTLLSKVMVDKIVFPRQ